MKADQVTMLIKVFRKNIRIIATENHLPKNQFLRADLEAEIEMIEEEIMRAILETLAEKEEIIEATTESLETIEAASTTKEMTEGVTSQEPMMITVAVRIITEVVTQEEVTKEEIPIPHKNLPEIIIPEIIKLHIEEEAIAEIISQLIVTEVVMIADQISEEMITISKEITILEAVTETEVAIEVATEVEAVTEAATEVALVVEEAAEAEAEDQRMKSQIDTPLMREKFSKQLNIWLKAELFLLIILINKWANTHHILKTDS